MNLGSAVSIIGNLDPNNLNEPVKFVPIGLIKTFVEYGNSKLGIMLFTKRLAQLLADTNISVFSVHPGTVQTEIVDELVPSPLKLLMKLIEKLYYKVSKIKLKILKVNS